MKIDPWDPQLAREWLKTASYEDLLRVWRFEPIGSPWFDRDTGMADSFEYYFKRARARVSVDDVVKASKRVGWDALSAPRGRYDDKRK